MQKIIIIGGGAAGFFAAITSAEADPEATVLILEQSREVLNKVRISGGGRCNVTHACWEPRELTKHYPRGSRELIGPFHTFCTGDTVDWFERRGVELKIEDDNRMFPTTDDSQTIMDCLIGAAQAAGVEVRTRSKVMDVTKEDDGKWKVQLAQGILRADKIMFATGSSPFAWKILARLGHEIVKPVPSLFTFNIKDERLEGLQGLSVPKATVNVEGSKLKATGPLLITHWGLSGPGILRLSAWGARTLHDLNYHFHIRVNFLGDLGVEEVADTLLSQNRVAKLVVNQNPFGLPARLWKKLVASSDLPAHARWLDLRRKTTFRLAEELCQSRFKVQGKSTFKEEFVTAGGVRLKEVDFKHFRSRLHDNLFFAGEVLNIDAITGGFNFQAAWTGGFLAGESMGGD